MTQRDNSELRDAGLKFDVDLKSPLGRVYYQAGMLLGLEATRAEQEYHRRHLNRHNYWFHGSGTVAGLRVYAKGDDVGDDTTQAHIQLHITPGIGIDGLGREVTVYEPYCIDFGAWLTAQFEDEDRWGTLISNGYDESGNLLWLKVTMRYQEVPSGLQPVMAVDINAGTDPVKPSRLLDGVLFELLAERPTDVPPGSHPFAAHNALPDWDNDLATKLNQPERDQLDTANGMEKKQLQLAARLLHAVADDNNALATREAFNVTAAEVARTLLARVAVHLTPEKKPIVNPRRLAVNNLARPFLFNAVTMAQLTK